MERLIFGIIVLTASISSFATGQRSDFIYVDGERWELLGQPARANADLFNQLLTVLPKDRILTSADWNGYTAYWSITPDERLRLDSIQVQFGDKNNPLQYHCVSLPDEDMLKVFQDYYHEVSAGEYSYQGIIAAWYTGEIRIARGKCLRYEHMGYLRNYEQEQIFVLQQGKVISRKTFDNGVVVDGFSFDDNYHQNMIKEKIQFLVENYPELVSDVADGSQIRIIFNVSKIQVDSLGNLLDCKVEVPRIMGIEVDQDLKDRMAQDMKATLMNIRPWKILLINGEYVSPKSVTIPYVIKR